jgi:hypothetical protein
LAPSKIQTLIARGLTSTFVLLVAMLFGCEIFLRAAQPLRWLNDQGFTTVHYNFLVAKLPELLAARDNKDVLLVGSSGVLVPAVRCDDWWQKQPTRYEKAYYRFHITPYSDAKYFEHVLANETATRASVCNAAVAAAVMSDEYLIVKKYLESGKRPKLVVLCVAPREFLDNTRSDVEHSATYSILADNAPPQIGRGLSALPAVIDGIFRWTSRLYGTRGDYRAVASAVASKLTKHPADLFTAAQAMRETKHQAAAPVSTAGAYRQATSEDNAGPIYQQPPNTLKDLDQYKAMYLPFNETQFATQSSYFEKCLTLLERNRVPVLVVDLPVTPQNYELLPPGVLDRYENAIAGACLRHHAALERPLDSVDFIAASDFEDSVHMNHNGGQKLFQAISRRIAKTPTFMAALKTSTAIAAR